MPELWLVNNFTDEECFNVYFSKARAEEAVRHFKTKWPCGNPRILGQIKEGEAFGEQVIYTGDGAREQDYRCSEAFVERDPMVHV